MWNRLQAYSTPEKVRQGYAHIRILQHERLHLGERCTEKSSRRIVGDRQKNLLLRLQNGKQTEKKLKQSGFFLMLFTFAKTFPDRHGAMRNSNRHRNTKIHSQAQWRRFAGIQARSFKNVSKLFITKFHHSILLWKTCSWKGAIIKLVSPNEFDYVNRGFYVEGRNRG